MQMFAEIRKQLDIIREAKNAPPTDTAADDRAVGAVLNLVGAFLTDVRRIADALERKD